MNPSITCSFILILLFALTPFASAQSQKVEEVKTILPHYYIVSKTRIGGVETTTYENVTYNLGRIKPFTSDTSSWGIFRTAFRFDLTSITTGASAIQIKKVELIYNTVNGSHTFKLTRPSSINGLTNALADWAAIANGTSVQTGIAYTGTLTTLNLIWNIRKA